MDVENSKRRIPVRDILGGSRTVTNAKHKHALSSAPELPPTKKSRTVSFKLHNDPHASYLSSGWPSVNKSARKVEETELGFSHEEFTKISNAEYVLMKPQQERTILQWMRKNHARLIGHHADAFEDLLESLDFKRPEHTPELHQRLKNKTEIKITALGRKLEKNGVITIRNRSCKNEIVTFMEWTGIWLTDMWDGTIDEPRHWETKLNGEESVIEEHLQLVEHSEDQSLTLHAEHFDVGEPEVEHIQTQNTEPPRRLYGSQVPAHPYTEDDPRTRHRSAVIFGGREKEEREEEYYDDNGVGERVNQPSQGCADQNRVITQAVPSFYVSPYSGRWDVQNNPEDGYSDNCKRVDEQGGEEYDHNGCGDEGFGGDYRRYYGREEHGVDNCEREEFSRREELVADELVGEESADVSAEKSGGEFLDLKAISALMLKRLDHTTVHRGEGLVGEEDEGALEIIDERYEYKDDEGVSRYGGAILF